MLFSLSLSFVAGFARRFRCQPDVQRCEPSRLHMIKTAVKIGDLGASINSRSNDMIRFCPSHSKIGREYDSIYLLDLGKNHEVETT